MPLVTLAEVAEHAGGNGKPEWVAFKGIVWDVSSNEVYRKGGGYSLFSGKDASVALGTMLFEKVDERGWRKLDQEQLECLEEWFNFYEQRYKRVGYLREEYGDKIKS